jgi:DNA-binding CsgD family transcriptional regulator
MPPDEGRSDGASGLETEALTRREREILALLADGLTGPEIGARLTLATSSVKSHVQHPYGKLGVHGKRQAVARGRALGLLPPAPALPATPPLAGAASLPPRPAAAPNVLPLPVARFFGREQEIVQARARLARDLEPAITAQIWVASKTAWGTRPAMWARTKPASQIQSPSCHGWCGR